MGVGACAPSVVERAAPEREATLYNSAISVFFPLAVPPRAFLQQRIRRNQFYPFILFVVALVFHKKISIFSKQRSSISDSV